MWLGPDKACGVWTAQANVKAGFGAGFGFSHPGSLSSANTTSDGTPDAGSMIPLTLDGLGVSLVCFATGLERPSSVLSTPGPEASQTPAEEVLIVEPPTEASAEEPSHNVQSVVLQKQVLRHCWEPVGSGAPGGAGAATADTGGSAFGNASSIVRDPLPPLKAPPPPQPLALRVAPRSHWDPQTAPTLRLMVSLESDVFAALAPAPRLPGGPQKLKRHILGSLFARTLFVGCGPVLG